MNANAESARAARRYLLGAASDEESAVIEQEYLEHEDALDRIAAAEDELIEDYLAGSLSPADREGFERHYLSAPDHRVRVEAIRRLLARGSQSAGSRPAKVSPFRLPRVTHPGYLLALAASLLIVASVGVRFLLPTGSQRADIVENRPPQPPVPSTQEPTAAPAPSAPRIFALTLSPVTVRSAADSTNIIIPAGTDAVAIRLERDVDGRALDPRRASIRRVGGDEVWQGPAIPDSNSPLGTVARLDVPTTRLSADDYLITLHGVAKDGREYEWNQYFLRVRAQ